MGEPHTKHQGERMTLLLSNPTAFSATAQHIWTVMLNHMGYNEIRDGYSDVEAVVIGWSTDMAFQPDPQLPANRVATINDKDQTVTITSEVYPDISETLTYDEIFAQINAVVVIDKEVV